MNLCPPSLGALHNLITQWTVFQLFQFIFGQSRDPRNRSREVPTSHISSPATPLPNAHSKLKTLKQSSPFKNKCPLSKRPPEVHRSLGFRTREQQPRGGGGRAFFRTPRPLWLTYTHDKRIPGALDATCVTATTTTGDVMCLDKKLSARESRARSFCCAPAGALPTCGGGGRDLCLQIQPWVERFPPFLVAFCRVLSTGFHVLAQLCYF